GDLLRTRLRLRPAPSDVLECRSRSRHRDAGRVVRLHRDRIRRDRGRVCAQRRADLQDARLHPPPGREADRDHCPAGFATASPGTDRLSRDMRIVLVTGKGGVGKTTVAAATALASADAGHRTLVSSTDPAHSLADALEVGLGDAPTQVVPNLDGQQIDTNSQLDRYWG